MARRAWYRSSEYSVPFEEKTLGDGSKVENIGDGDERLLTRTYPWGSKQEIHFVILPSGERKYLNIDPGPESPNQLKGAERAAAFEMHLANGEVRTHPITSAVPGNRPGDNYDSATRKTFASRTEFDQEYDRMKLAKLMGSDHSTMRISDGGYDGPGSAGGVEIKQFRVDSQASMPPLPTGKP